MSKRHALSDQTLYLHHAGGGRYFVTNFDGSVQYPVTKIRHKKVKLFGRVPSTREDFRFVGPDGREWTGYQLGDWNTFAHVRPPASRGRRNPWDARTATRDGFESWELVVGDVEAHVDGFSAPAPASLRGDWVWAVSTVRGKYRELRGKVKTKSAAMKAAERAVTRLLALF